jgi:subfamily B ATP-binding cassette protein HlyB/CyaB
VLLLALLSVLGCQLALHVLAESLWARLQWRLSARLDGIVYRQIFRSTVDWREELGPGMTQAWLREAEQLKVFAMRELPTFLIEALGVVAVFLVLVSKSPALGLLPAGGFLICFLAWFLYRSTLRRNETSGFLLSAATGNLLLEQVRGMETIRSLGGGKRFVSEWRALAEESARRDVNLARQATALDTFTGVVALVCEALSLYLVCLLAIGGTLSVGEVVSVAMYVSLLFGPMSNLASFYDRWRKVRAAFKRMLELFLTSRDELAFDIPPFEGRHFGFLAFENVKLQLRDGRALSLGEGSFVLRPEERIVIRGEAGSGKSQLARLLALRAEPSRGRILLDARPLGALSTRVVGMHVALLARNTRPLGVTVGELLTYGLSRPPHEEIDRLCHITGLHGELRQSHLTFASAAQDMGSPLPESVIQLCALIRILLARPRILVLDDALSSLPEEREVSLLRSLFEHFPEVAFVVLTRHAWAMPSPQDSVAEEAAPHARPRRPRFYRLSSGADVTGPAGAAGVLMEVSDG